METVGLLSCMCSEDFYCWGLVWVEHETDLIFEEMVMEVVDFDVVGFDNVVEDFVENFVEDFEEKNVGMVDRMVDTDSIESIFHRDFVLLVPKIEIDLKLRPRLLPRIPRWRLIIHLIMESLCLRSLPRPSRDKIEGFCGTCRSFFLKDSFETRKRRKILGLMFLRTNDTGFYKFYI